MPQKNVRHGWLPSHAPQLCPRAALASKALHIAVSAGQKLECSAFSFSFRLLLFQSPSVSTFLVEKLVTWHTVESKRLSPPRRGAHGEKIEPTGVHRSHRTERNGTESNVTEPNRAEQNRPDPTRTGPSRTDPTRPGPNRTGRNGTGLGRGTTRRNAVSRFAIGQVVNVTAHTTLGENYTEAVCGAVQCGRFADGGVGA